MASVLVRFLKQEKIFIDVMMVASLIFFSYAAIGTEWNSPTYVMYSVYGVAAFLFALRAKNDLEKKLL